MTIVIPVSHVDVHLAFDLFFTIRCLQRKATGTQIPTSPIRAHQIVIMSTPRARCAARVLWGKFDRLCRNTTHHMLSSDGPGAWPIGANFMFKEAAKYVHDSGYDSPWYFMEADNTPIVEDWMEQLEAEYLQSGCRFLGYVHSVLECNEQGNESYKPDSLHMNGSGLYPTDIIQSANMQTIDSNPWPWDIYMSKEILSSCHPSKLIQTNWGTEQYKRDEEGILTCRPSKKSYNLCAKPVLPGVAVVHGCKDGSLSRLVLQENRR